MSQSLTIPGLGAPHATVALEGTLADGFFEPSAATVQASQSNAHLRCVLPAGVRIPEWAIDTGQQPPELSPVKAKAYLNAQAAALRQRAQAQLLDALRRLESVHVHWRGDDKFFGASIEAEGEAKIFMSQWLAEEAPPANALVAEFTVRITGSVDSTVSLMATSAVTVALRTNDIPKLRFGSDDLNFSFPEIEFPTLDFTKPLRDLLPDGQGISRLLERLGAMSGTGVVAKVKCTDGPGQQLVIDLSGGRLQCALVKPAQGPIRWDDLPALRTQLATFEVTFEGTPAAQASITGVRLAVVNGQFIQEGTIQAGVDLPSVASKQGRLGAFQWQVEDLRTRLEGIATTTDSALVAKVKFKKLRIWLADDPAAALAFEGEVELTPSGARLISLKLLEPTELQLLQGGAQALARGARSIATLAAKFGNLDASVVRKLFEILGKFAAAAARQAFVVGEAIVNAAEEAGRVIGSMLDALGEAIKSFLETLRDLIPDGPEKSDVEVQVTLSLDPFEILQILVLKKALAQDKELDEAGLHLKLHGGWQLGLLVDLGANPGAYVVAAWPGDENATGSAPLASLGTDLWIESEETVSHAPDADPKTGDRPATRLIEVKATHKDAKTKLIAVIAGVCRGEPVFLKRLNVAGKTATDGVIVADGPPKLDDLGSAIDVDVAFAVKRILPLLGMGETGDTDTSTEDGFLEKLKKGVGQVVSVESFDGGKFDPEKFEVDSKLKLNVKAAGISSTVDLGVKLSLRTLRASFTGPSGLALKSKRIEEDALGLTWVVEQIDEETRKKNTEVEMFRLSFSGGESGFELNAQAARMQLRFGGLSKDGEGVVFNVTEFRVGRRGVDITAEVDDKAVRLNGLDVPFQFTSGKLVMRASRLVEAAVAGRGSLPPALVGEADCTLALAFAQGSDGIELQSGKVEIDKKGEPIVCHSTRFTLTVSDLDVGIQKDGGAYHFYFLVTGSLRFTPKDGEFEGGLLGFLKDIEINLERAPLTGDARVLAKHISFQKALNPKKSFNLFNLFTFELRGFGFHPASPRFDGKPAINLSGQIKFAEIGDVMQPSIDFHGLWIAPPADGEALPRISCEGLGLDLQLSGSVKIRGSVLAVDPSTRTVEGKQFAPPGYNTYGFLGEGAVDIPGWGSMQASLGFLEVERKTDGERFKAFFIYLQKDKLAVQIPTGFWTFYMREAGFGFGFRYTLAGIRDADTATSPAHLIRILDDVSKRQGDLARYAAWSPDTNPEANRFTLALRAAIQAYPAEQTYNQETEETASNPFFFDVIVALRSDLTLLASMRGYLGVNYADFRANKNNFRERPGLRGYLYISAPRSELLARMIADSKGFIGERFPGLQSGQILRRAVESVDWSSTLYIRPGLFHYEMGWPDQLSVRLVDTNNMKVSLRGGMIFRAAEDGLLWGYNIEADAWLRFGGSVGSDIGVAAEASMQARFIARLIAYLSWRFQGSLVYGLVSLDATLAFSVRAWMKVNLRFTSFTIRIGFSFSVHFSAAIEMAIATDGVGARAHARISVSAFGCSLGVFIGFSFNDGALESARARVQRFMAMSITAEEPAETPKVGAKDADQRADDAAQRTEKVAQVPPDGQATEPQVDEAGNLSIFYPPEAGRVIHATDFWMVLHSSAEEACALLVPREADDRDKGGFYCAPRRFAGPDRPAHTLYVSGIDPALLATIRIVDAEGKEWPLVLGANWIPANWEAPVPMESGSSPVTLGDLADQCFLTNVDGLEDGQGGVQIVSWGWQEPGKLRISESKHQRPAGSEQERNLQRDAMQKDQTVSAANRPADERAYQGRSTIMTMFLDQFVSFAMHGKRPDTSAHVLDLGLVLRGSAKTLQALAKALQVEKADSLGELGGVSILNPADTWFVTQDPVFGAPRGEVGPTGPRLAWDLSLPWMDDPPMAVSAGPESKGIDPDHFLLQYEIVRTVETREFTPHVMRVKPASTMGGVDEKNVVKLLKPDWQFTDDLADLGEDWRHALLPPRNEQEAVQAAGAWMKLGLDADVTITYSITPIDIAGTKGLPRSFALTVDKPRPAVRSAQAELRIVQDVKELPAWQGRADVPQNLQVFIGLKDAAWAGDKRDLDIGGEKFDVKREYRIYVEHETVLPAGSFGSDGLTDRLRGFGGERTVALAIERALSQPGHLSRTAFGTDRLVDVLEPGPKTKFADHIVQYVEGDLDTRTRLPLWTLLGGGKVEGVEAFYADLLKQLWAAGDDRLACRFWLRTEIAFYRKGAKDAEYRLASTPVEIPVSLALRKGAKGPATAVVQPQAFEWPVELRLPPLPQGQVRVQTGFLHVMAPQSEATLGQWSKAHANEALIMLRDPSRRTLTVLEFDAVPVLPANVLHPLHKTSFAGYDVHALDLDDLAPIDSTPGDLGQDARAWMRARRVAHVKLVSDGSASLTPATNADWLGWHASYPSETWRTERPKDDAPKNQAVPIRKGWYSASESLPLFAQRQPRWRLLPHAVDSYVDELLLGGLPDTIIAKLAVAVNSPAQKTIGSEIDRTAITARPLSSGEEPWSGSARDGFTIAAQGERFVAARLRYMLLCLCRPEIHPDALRRWQNDPHALDGLSLIVEARIGNKTTASVTIPLQFGSPMHGIIEETIAELAWGERGTDKAGFPLLYRQHAVTVQAPPTIDAREFGQYLAATASSTDPYGWGVLQGLGLAATLKLYDVTSGRFERASTLADKCNAVFAAVVVRWVASSGDKWQVAGQPFAEVLLRPGANRVPRPFDGLAERGTEAYDVLIDDRALSMVQLSLRPAPMQAFQYMKLVIPPRTAENFLPVTPRGARVRQLVLEVRLDVEDVVDVAIAGQAATARIDKAGKCSLPVVLPAEYERRGDDVGFQTREMTIIMRRRNDRKGRADAILSYVATVEVPAAQGVDVDTPRPVETMQCVMERPQGDEQLQEIARPGEAVSEYAVDPFGFFDAQPADLWAKEAGAKLEATESLRHHLKAVAPDMRFPQEEADWKTVVPQYLEWMRRMLDHARSPQASKAAIALALAAPSRVSPCEVAPDSSGCVTVSIPGDDKLAHAKAYAVRPISRYAHVLAGAGVHPLEETEQLLDAPAQAVPADGVGYAVAVVPRTERVEQPVILGSSIVEGHWELVLGRHAEESMAHSNRPLFARLGKPSMLVSQMRTYRTPQWPERLRQRFSPIGEWNLYPERIAGEPAQRPDWEEPDAAPSRQSLRRLSQRRLADLAVEYPGLWKGAEVLAFTSPPPQYRMAALAVARGGIVLSNISTAVQDDFPREPIANDRHEVPDPLRPVLRVTRVGDEPSTLEVNHRLVSHHDLTPEAARTWETGGKDDIAWWPDPDVVYNVVHRAKSGKAVVDEEVAETRLVAQMPGDPAADAGPVVMRVRGGRWLVVGGDKPNEIRRADDDALGRAQFDVTLRYAVDPAGPSAGADTQQLTQADTNHKSFKRFAQVCRPFALCIVHHARSYQLARLNAEADEAYLLRVQELASRLREQIKVVDEAAKTYPGSAQLEPGASLAQEMAKLTDALDQWFAAHGGAADAAQQLEKALDPGGALQPYTTAMSVPYPVAGYAPGKGMALDLEAGGEGVLILNDVPTDAESEAVQAVSHPLAKKDSRFWQLAVRRMKAGADVLLLRVVDGRGVGPGSGAEPSIGWAAIEWPAFVTTMVS
ncbi:hypothetical protein WKW79_34545 [Variovorax robiniae]|uniref:Uncharacterized protein n=1 Tax=Variovorax robiniae TaxID=1836199 RepID=A0ABU8XIJ9_9BURK